MDFKKKNIFLDLDNTIICSELYNSDIKKHIFSYDYDFIERYVTVSRPNLQYFLDFLFKNFNVSIWTAGSKNYASFIFTRFIKKYDENRNLILLLYNEHCELSKKYKNGNIKDLKMLWEIWKVPGFNKKNTFIIDDLKDVYDIQPENCFKIKAFKIKGFKNDNELINLLPKLEYIK